jgi:hypothetical protein
MGLSIFTEVISLFFSKSISSSIFFCWLNNSSSLVISHTPRNLYSMYTSTQKARLQALQAAKYLQASVG